MQKFYTYYCLRTYKICPNRDPSRSVKWLLGQPVVFKEQLLLQDYVISQVSNYINNVVFMPFSSAVNQYEFVTRRGSFVVAHCSRMFVVGQKPGRVGSFYSSRHVVLHHTKNYCIKVSIYRNCITIKKLYSPTAGGAGVDNTSLGFRPPCWYEIQKCKFRVDFNDITS